MPPPARKTKFGGERNMSHSGFTMFGIEGGSSKSRGPELQFQHDEMGTKSFSKCAEPRLELVDRGIEPPSSPFDWPVFGSR